MNTRTRKFTALALIVFMSLLSLRVSFASVEMPIHDMQMEQMDMSVDCDEHCKQLQTECDDCDSFCTTTAMTTLPVMFNQHFPLLKTQWQASLHAFVIASTPVQLFRPPRT